MKTAVGEARTAVAAESGEPATVVRGPWTRRHRRPGGGPPGRGSRASGGRRGGPRRCRPRLVPERRVARPRRDPGALRRPLHPVRWPCRRRRLRARRPTAGTSSATRFLALAAESAPPDPRARDRDRPRAPGPRRRLRAATASSPGWRRADPGNADPLVAVLGLTVTRVRAATGGHTPADPPPRPRRPRRDRVRSVRHRRGRPRGRPARRRGPADQPDVRWLRVAPARHPRRRRRPGSHPRTAADPRLRRPAMPALLAGSALVTRAGSAAPRAGDPSGIGPVRSLAGARPVDRRPAARRRSSRSACSRAGSRSAAVERERQRQRQRRAGTGRPRRRTSSSFRRGRDLQGLDRLRQGRQHLGPDRQGRQAS